MLDDIMSNASIPEELLSAYVDGQLTASEKLRAEQLIAESPPCAEFVNELRSQSRMLKGIPRFQLDNGFAKRVLVAAEEKAIAHKQSLRTLETGNAFPLWNPQTIASAICALAAMLLVTLFAFNANWFGEENSMAGKSLAKNWDGATIMHRPKESGNSVSPENDTVVVSEIPDAKSDEVPGSSAASTELAESGTDSLTGTAEAGVPTEPGNVANPESTEDVGQIVNVIPSQNVDEVWYIDISGRQAIERLQTAFRQNKIQFRTGKKSSSQVASTTRSARVEAMYIYSTKSQIQGAMAQITQDADILAYSIPSEPMEQPVVAREEATAEANVNAAVPTIKPFSMAQQLPLDLYLPKGLDHTTKLKSLALPGELVPPMSEQQPEQQPAAFEPESKGENPPEVELDENGEKPWYVKAEEERAQEDAAGSITEIEDTPKQEEAKKRFLLLIRFEGDS